MAASALSFERVGRHESAAFTADGSLWGPAPGIDAAAVQGQVDDSIGRRNCAHIPLVPAVPASRTRWT
jgi:hypothetical protein